MTGVEKVPEKQQKSLENALIAYWRNSLADQDLIGVSKGKQYPINKAAMESGRISANLANNLCDQNSTPDRAVDQVEVLIGTNIFSKIIDHGAKKYAGAGNAGESRYTTLWIPAVLKRDGRLKPAEAKPWVGREYLRPLPNSEYVRPIVGEISQFDGWVTRKSLEDPNWKELMKWTKGLWEAVYKVKVADVFQELEDECYLIVEEVQQGVSASIINLYDALEKEKATPKLFACLCQGEGDAHVVDDRLRTKQFTLPRGTMNAAYGLARSQSDAVDAYTMQENGEALAVNGPPGTGKTALLQAIIATEVVTRALKDALPPVIVGASTNNQAVTNIVESLNSVLRENSSTCFSPWAQRWIPDVNTVGMYLPGGNKVNEAKKKGYPYAVRSGADWDGLPGNLQDEGYVRTAEEGWKVNFRTVYGIKLDTVRQGCDRIVVDLKGILGELDVLKACFNKLEDIRQFWREIAGEMDPEDYIAHRRRVFVESQTTLSRDISYKKREIQNHQTDAEKQIDVLTTESRAIQEHLDRLRKEEDHLLALDRDIRRALAPRGISEQLARLLPPLRQDAQERQSDRAFGCLPEEGDLKQIFREAAHSRKPETWRGISAGLLKEKKAELEDRQREFDVKQEEIAKTRSARGEVIQSLEAECQEMERELTELTMQAEAEERGLKEKKTLLEACISESYALFDKNLKRLDRGKPESPTGDLAFQDFQELADRTLRFELFHKAMRYWEGRWLIEMGMMFDQKQKDTPDRASRERMFRRWCMLTPCLVMTMHTLPRHFTAKENGDYTHMLEFIDLLIVDEAGQVSPDTGMASFGMAKKAVIVGDVHQLEPIATITSGIDMSNATRHGLDGYWENGNPTRPWFVSDSEDATPNGSLIRIAQDATCATSAGQDNEQGIFLSEHRRCLMDIINYCNRLIYSGRLEPMRGQPETPPPLPPMGWAHVQGTCEKAGGSNSNPKEAQATLKWIHDNKDEWKAYYKEKELKDIVAIVTPFRGQKNAVDNVIRQTPDYQDMKDITVGTVHSLQGADRPVIIFSPTYSSAESKGTLFFDQKPNMMNVAVSRAKDAFVVIGDMKLFRNPGKRPSSVLGEILFASPDNELGGVDGNYRLKDASKLVNAERLSRPEEHSDILRKSISDLAPGETLYITSPWITLKAIKDDDLERLCRTTTNRKASVSIFVDDELSRSDAGTRKADEAIDLMRKAGAEVYRVQRMHNKTLVVGEREIIEGSFNWLSAHRKPGDDYLRKETSWRITGPEVQDVIRELKVEFKEIKEIMVSKIV